MSSTAASFTGNQYLTRAFADTIYSASVIANLNSIPPPIANYSFGNFKLTNIGTPTVNTDAASKSYVDGRISSEISNSLAAFQPALIRSSTAPTV